MVVLPFPSKWIAWHIGRGERYRTRESSVFHAGYRPRSKLWYCNIEIDAHFFVYLNRAGA